MGQASLIWAFQAFLVTPIFGASLPGANYLYDWEGDLGSRPTQLINPNPVPLINFPAKGPGGASASLLLANMPSAVTVDITEISPPKTEGFAAASATLQLYFRVNQKKTLNKLIDSVPVLAHLKGFATQDGFDAFHSFGGGTLYFGIGVLGDPSRYYELRRNVNFPPLENSPPSTKFSLTKKQVRTLIPVGQVVLVLIAVGVQASCGARQDDIDCRSHGNAVIDPTFLIDPSFEDADAFDLEYSPNYVPPSDDIEIADVNNDGAVNCLDLDVVKTAFGTRAGQPAYKPEADVDDNGVVDVRDLAIVSQHLPAGTVCRS